MKVIGAGLPKTGTTSMAAALKELGYKVHDNAEHIEYNFQNYLDLINGVASEDILKDMYKDVDVVVDTPACHFWRNLARLFPEAKVVLTVRDDAEGWYKSCVKTVEYMKVSNWWSMSHWYSPFLNHLSETTRRIRLLFGWIGRLTICMDTVYFPGEVSAHAPLGVSKTVVMNNYLQHVAAVQHEIPEDRLLIFNVKQGWEPLCKFLGKPIPATPFPNENKTNNNGTVPIIDDLKTVTIFKKAETEVWKSVIFLGSTLIGLGILIKQPTNLLANIPWIS